MNAALKQRIVIIDTGCANLSSVNYAVTRLGYRPQISRDPAVISRADKLFLPGVGTAQAAMAQLRKRDLIDTLLSCRQPTLGICLGMQLYATTSEENGSVKTLDIIPAPVLRLRSGNLPLPHIGWNTVSSTDNHPLFRDIEQDAYFYFVHSFALACRNYTIATTTYGEPFSAAVQSGNFFGVQFHPERSGRAGATLLRNFLEMPS